VLEKFISEDVQGFDYQLFLMPHVSEHAVKKRVIVEPFRSSDEKVLEVRQKGFPIFDKMRSILRVSYNGYYISLPS
jgi:hypothetical protein